MSIRRKISRNSGFTLTELLVAIGIMAIVAAIAIPSIFIIKSSLKMTELDDTATEIYLSVQSELVNRKAAGTLAGFKDTIPSGRKIYPIKPQDYGSIDDNWKNIYYITSEDTAALKYLVGDLSFETDVLSGYFLIELDPDSGSVYGVFYAEEPFEYVADVQSLPSRDRSDRKKAEPPLGYFGGSLDTSSNANLMKKLEPKATFQNGQELYLEVFCPNLLQLVRAQDKLTFDVTITDEHGNTYAVTKTGGKDFSITADALTLNILLDSMEKDSSGNDIYSLQKLTGLYGGDDLTASVHAKFSYGSILIEGDSGSEGATSNSLFGAKESDGGVTTYYISCLRHLYNLREAKLAYDGADAQVVISQSGDIDFAAASGFTWKKGKFDPTAVNPIKSAGFTPISNTTLDGKATYNGNGKELRNFTIKATGDVGIFGQLNGWTLSNTMIADPIVTGVGASNAGSLAGSLTGGKIANCGVYLNIIDSETGDYYANLESSDPSNYINMMKERLSKYTVSSANSSSVCGGLVGAAEGCEISSAFAAIDVKGNNVIGGLAGTLTNCTVDNCYSSGDIANAGTITAAGGFVGQASGGTVANSYSTSDITADGPCGGFAGQITGGSYSGTHSFGQVMNNSGLQNSATSGGFVGALSGSSFSNCSFLTQKGYNDEFTAADARPGAAAYADLDAALNAEDGYAAASYPYDVNLYESDGPADFPFRYIININGDSNQVLTHHGDWPRNYTIQVSLVYYERYTDGDYGLYCVTSIASSTNTDKWVLNTLRDEACAEDGYALMSINELSYYTYYLNSYLTASLTKNGTTYSKGSLFPELLDNDITNDDSLTYNSKNYTLTTVQIASKTTVGGGSGGCDTSSRLVTESKLTFYKMEDEVEGTVDTGDSFDVMNLCIYQFPFTLQENSRASTTSFYDLLYISAAYSKENKPVIRHYSFYYNPHFAKNAINPNPDGSNHTVKPKDPGVDIDVSAYATEAEKTKAREFYSTVYVRSARQLNALGRFYYYWNPANSGIVNSSSYGGTYVYWTFKQETDLDFGIYVKKYCGKAFNLMDTSSSNDLRNRPIGISGSNYQSGVRADNFQMYYDGQGNSIIDYCLVTDSDKRFCGLFGEIEGSIKGGSNPAHVTEIKNINLVASDPEHASGYVTSNYNGTDNTGTGALVGLVYSEVENSTQTSSAVINCSVSGYTVIQNIENSDQGNVSIGGLTGYNMGTLQKCSSDCYIVKAVINKSAFDGQIAVGGLAGCNYTTIESCYAGGELTITGSPQGKSSIAGIAARPVYTYSSVNTKYTATVANCYSFCTIRNLNNSNISYFAVACPDNGNNVSYIGSSSGTLTVANSLVIANGLSGAAGESVDASAKDITDSFEGKTYKAANTAALGTITADAPGTENTEAVSGDQDTADTASTGEAAAKEPADLSALAKAAAAKSADALAPTGDYTVVANTYVSSLRLYGFEDIYSSGSLTINNVTYTSGISENNNYLSVAFSSNKNFEVGDTVTVYYAADNETYQGTVTSINYNNNTYNARVNSLTRISYRLTVSGLSGLNGSSATVTVGSTTYPAVTIASGQALVKGITSIAKDSAVSVLVGSNYYVGVVDTVGTNTAASAVSRAYKLTVTGLPSSGTAYVTVGGTTYSATISSSQAVISTLPSLTKDSVVTVLVGSTYYTGTVGTVSSYAASAAVKTAYILTASGLTGLTSGTATVTTGGYTYSATISSEKAIAYILPTPAVGNAITVYANSDYYVGTVTSVSGYAVAATVSNQYKLTVTGLPSSGTAYVTVGGTVYSGSISSSQVVISDIPSLADGNTVTVTVGNNIYAGTVSNTSVTAKTAVAAVTKLYNLTVTGLTGLTSGTASVTVGSATYTGTISSAQTVIYGITSISKDAVVTVTVADTGDVYLGKVDSVNTSTKEAASAVTKSYKLTVSGLTDLSDGTSVTAEVSSGTYTATVSGGQVIVKGISSIASDAAVTVLTATDSYTGTVSSIDTTNKTATAEVAKVTTYTLTVSGLSGVSNGTSVTVETGNGSYTGAVTSSQVIISGLSSVTSGSTVTVLTATDSYTGTVSSVNTIRKTAAATVSQVTTYTLTAAGLTGIADGTSVTVEISSGTYTGTVSGEAAVVTGLSAVSNGASVTVLTSTDSYVGKVSSVNTIRKTAAATVSQVTTYTLTVTGLSSVADGTSVTVQVGSTNYACTVSGGQVLITDQDSATSGAVIIVTTASDTYTGTVTSVNTIRKTATGAVSKVTNYTLTVNGLTAVTSGTSVTVKIGSSTTKTATVTSGQAVVTGLSSVTVGTAVTVTVSSTTYAGTVTFVNATAKTATAYVSKSSSTTSGGTPWVFVSGCYYLTDTIIGSPTLSDVSTATNNIVGSGVTGLSYSDMSNLPASSLAVKLTTSLTTTTGTVTVGSRTGGTAFSADVTAANSHPWDSVLEGYAYPFLGVVSNDSVYAHYGNWPLEVIPGGYLVYYEAYGDGTYGYYFVDKSNKVYNTLDTPSDSASEKTITAAGYGLLATSAAGSGDLSSYVALDIIGAAGTVSVPSPVSALVTGKISVAISTTLMSGTKKTYTYDQLYTFTDAAMAAVQPTSAAPDTEVYLGVTFREVDYKYTNIHNGYTQNLYVNMGFAAAISPQPDRLGTELLPLQIRSDGHINAINNLPPEGYLDLEVTHSFTVTDAGAGKAVLQAHYSLDGGIYSGDTLTGKFTITGLQNPLLASNAGTVSNLRLAGCKPASGDVAGLVLNNTGTVSAVEILDPQIVSADGNAAGLALNNSGTITGCQVSTSSGVQSTIKATTGSAAGLVYNNMGTGMITGCTVTCYLIEALGSDTGDAAAGFVYSNNGTITSLTDGTACAVTVTGGINAQLSAAGFAYRNYSGGKLSLCQVSLQSGAYISVQNYSKGAAGFACICSGSASIADCSVTGTGTTPIFGHGASASGFILELGGTDGSTASVKNCTVSGVIVGSEDKSASSGSAEGTAKATGFVYSVTQEALVSGCTVTDCTLKTKGSGTAAGFAYAVTGYRSDESGSQLPSVTDCAVTGTTAVTAGSGAAGFVYANSSVLSACTVGSGDAQCSVSTVLVGASGFVAQNTGSAVITDCSADLVSVATGDKGSYAAGFAGENDSAIEDCVCAVSGSIIGKTYAAGFVYLNLGAISDCDADLDALVKASSGSASGFVSYNRGGESSEENGRITGCDLSFSYHGSDGVVIYGKNASGFAYENDYTGLIENCGLTFSDGNGKNCVISGTAYAAGFAIQNGVVTDSTSAIEGCEVSNVDIKGEDYASGFIHGIGMSAAVSDCQVADDVGLEGGSISGFVYLMEESASVSGCSVTGVTISAEETASGFAYQLMDSSSIESCYASSPVISAADSASGFVHTLYSANKDGAVRECAVSGEGVITVEDGPGAGFAYESTGLITGDEGCYVSGLTLSCSDTAAGFICNNDGEVENSFVYDSSVESSGGDASGFAGSNGGDAGIIGCGAYATGDYDGMYVTAFVNAAGFILENAGSLSECFAAGTIEASGDAAGFAVEAGDLDACYSNCLVSADGDGAAFAIGGGDITNCYASCDEDGVAVEAGGEASGFVLGGDCEGCYTLCTAVSSSGGTVYAFGPSSSIGSNCYWVSIADDGYAAIAAEDFDESSLSGNWEAAGSEETVSYGSGPDYPWPMLRGLTHYGNWPDVSMTDGTEAQDDTEDTDDLADPEESQAEPSESEEPAAEESPAAESETLETASAASPEAGAESA